MAGTEQEDFWRGDFGDAYVDRSKSAELVAARTALWTRILKSTTGVESVTVSDRASDTRAPWVYCFWAAPAQSAVPACRKTSVSPHPAAEPGRIGPAPDRGQQGVVAFHRKPFRRAIQRQTERAASGIELAAGLEGDEGLLPVDLVRAEAAEREGREVLHVVVVDHHAVRLGRHAEVAAARV